MELTWVAWLVCGKPSELYALPKSQLTFLECLILQPDFAFLKQMKENRKEKIRIRIKNEAWFKIRYTVPRQRRQKLDSPERYSLILTLNTRISSRKCTTFVECT